MSSTENTGLVEAGEANRKCCSCCSCCSTADGCYDDWVRPLLAEFSALTIFTFIGVLSSAAKMVIVSAISQGFTLTILVSIFGPISGGHVNPAVSLAMLLAGEIPICKTLGYVVCQTFGSLLGAALAKAVANPKLHVALERGLPGVSDGTTLGQALLCETCVTLVLLLTVFMVSVGRQPSPLAPLAIGATVIAGTCAGGAISGAAMNPARAFGAVFVFHTNKAKMWREQWIYWLGPTFAALLAATLFRLVFASAEKRVFCQRST